jgi:O-antigen/teichoic acid export membrane protein
MDSIARGSVINLVTRVLAVALGLAITLYTARLGTASQGAFALFAAVESVLLALVSGFGVAIARRISHHGERPSGLVGASLLASIGLGLLVAAGLSLVSSMSGPAYQSLWLLALAAPMLFVSPNLCGIWLGRGRMAALARITLGAPALTLAGIALLQWAGQPPALATVLWAWIGARWVVALAVFGVATRGGWLARPDGAALANEARFVVVIGLTNLVGLLNYKADLFFVEHFLGLSAAGVYSIAVMVAELLWLVSSSVTTAAYARIGVPDSREAARITIRAVHAGVLVLALLCPLLWAGAALAVPVLLGTAYEGALAALAVLLPGVAVFGAASALSAWFTNHAGRPWVPALLASLSLAINVVVSVIAIPRIGMIGGALATSLSYSVAVAAAALLFVRASGTPAAVLLRPDWRALAADIGRLRAAH